MRLRPELLALAAIAGACALASCEKAHALSMVADYPVISDSAAILQKKNTELDETKKINACFQSIQAASGKTGKNAGCGTPKTPADPCPNGTQGGNTPASQQAQLPTMAQSGGGAGGLGSSGSGVSSQTPGTSTSGAGGMSGMPSISGQCKGTSDMVKSAGLSQSANGTTAALQSATGMGQPMSGSSAISASLGKLNAVINGQVTGPDAITQLKSVLYINSTAAPTAQQVESVNDIRRLNIQNASIEALKAALQAKNAAANLSGGTLKAMMSDAQNTGDQRQDMAANTTAMLKMLEQAVVQNGLLAADLHLECAVKIGNDGTNGRDGGNQSEYATGASGSSSTASGSQSSGSQ